MLILSQAFPTGSPFYRYYSWYTSTTTVFCMNANVKSFLTTPSHRYYYRTIMVNFHYYLPDGNMMVGLHPHANVRTMVAPAEISLLLTYTLDPFLHRCSGCVHPYSPRFSLLLCW